MSKKQINGLLERLNVLIDKRIIEGKDYKALAKQHKKLITIINK